MNRNKQNTLPYDQFNEKVLFSVEYGNFLKNLLLQRRTKIYIKRNLHDETRYKNVMWSISPNVKYIHITDND